MADDAQHKAEELKGKAKQKLGEATGNEQWVAEGKAEQTKADLEQAGEKVKDALTPDTSSSESKDG